MPVLQLPNIPAAMLNWELRIHPNEREMTRMSNKWFASHKLFPPHRYEEWTANKFSLMAAMCYPDAPGDKLRVCMDYISILFSFDDLMDTPGDGEETRYMHDADGAKRTAQTLMHIFKKPEEFKPVETLPVLTAYHDFWLRFARDATQGQRRRFIDTFQAYVHGLQEQVINCIHQTCPSIERYVKLRRNISAIWTTMALIEYIYAIDVPDAVYSHPAVFAFLEAGIDIISWANDIYSFNNEQACGDCHNLVAVVAIQRNLPVQAAVDFVYSMILEAIARFWRAREKFPSFGEKVDPVVLQYLHGVEMLVVGSTVWHIESQRYFGPQIREFRQTLRVEIKPLEEGVASPFGFRYEDAPRERDVIADEPSPPSIRDEPSRRTVLRSRS